MATKIIMPKMGLTMVEGRIIKWLKNEGDVVKKDDPLLEIESDKSSFTVEAPEGGILKAVLYQEDEVVPCGETIAIVAGEDEDIADFVSTRNNDENENKDEKDQLISKTTCSEETDKHLSDNRIKISPRARRLAKQHGVDIERINGTGPNGRIIEKDIKKFLNTIPNAKTTPLASKIAKDRNVDIGSLKGSGISGRIYSSDIETVKADKTQDKDTILESGVLLEDKTVPYKGMRRIIGDRLSQSKFSAPHIYFTISVDMSNAVQAREAIKKKKGDKISYNDMIVCAVSRALTVYPSLNASLNNDEIVYHGNINIGIAVALEEGLIVPVIRDAHKMNLSQISKCSAELISRARDNKLMPDEYKGGTFTISNLGMTGIENFTAIINPPEVAILAVSAIKKKAIVNDDTNTIEVKPIMKMTLSVDHRVVDGRLATDFLNRVKDYLEEPYCLL
jgi:pyruvate dehydrogenase E2 component (dihydrolipoamide acetyltransferase)